MKIGDDMKWIIEKRGGRILVLGDIAGLCMNLCVAGRKI